MLRLLISSEVRYARFGLGTRPMVATVDSAYDQRSNPEESPRVAGGRRRSTLVGRGLRWLFFVAQQCLAS